MKGKDYEWTDTPEWQAAYKKRLEEAQIAADQREREMREYNKDRSDYAMPYSNTAIKEGRKRAYAQYLKEHPTITINGQTASLDQIRANKNYRLNLQRDIADLDKATKYLTDRLSNIKVDPVIERGAGGYTPTKTTPTKTEKPYTPPANLAEIQSYEELSKAIQYYNKVKDAATTDADRRKAQQTIDTLEEMRKGWDAAASTAKGYKPPTALADIKSISAANDALTYYRKAFDDAVTPLQRKVLGGIIDNIEALKKSWTGTTEAVAVSTPRWRSTLDEIRADLDRIYGLPSKLIKVEVQGMGFDGITRQIKQLEAMKYMPGLNEDDRKGIDDAIAKLKQLRAGTVTAMGTFTDMWDATKSLQGGIQSMTKVTDENATAWDKVSAVVDGAMQMYRAITQIIHIVDAANMASSATKQSTAAANVAASNAEATADTNAAAAAMFKAHAWLPWVGVALGAAAVATMVATMFSLPKYAQGGIAYGPTVGMFGEYANASTNPEVVAPLDRLRTLIQPQGLGGEVEFKIEGRTLRGILNKVDNHNSRI